jgi:hypothetical protein
MILILSQKCANDLCIALKNCFLLLINVRILNKVGLWVFENIFCFYNFQAENDVKCACTFVLRPFETHSSIQILSPFFNARTIVLPHATRTPVEPVASQAV